jgi:homoserine acetyltransferase
VLIAKSTTKWKVGDEKHFHFVFGGQNLLVQKMQGFIPKSSSVDGVISNIKIHNYCKTDFRDSIRSADIEDEILLTKPCDLIEISKDNVTFYKVGDAELPFFFKNVLSDGVVPVYVRTTIPNGLTGKEKRTAELLGQWDIGI